MKKFAAPTRQRKRRTIWFIPILFTTVFFLYSIFTSNQKKNTNFGGRHLLAEESSQHECVPPSINDFPNDFLTQEQRLQGGVIFHIVISCYICYALAIVCDDYFVPSLGGISEAFDLPSDIAGATFMAAGTSAPELFTSVIGSFITEGDIGVGTIVGSAVFNILAVVAVCGLLVKAAIPLEWWPLTRDCSAYTVAVLALMVIIWDSIIYWYEALVLIILFCLYIVSMYYNEKIETSVAACFKCNEKEEKENCEKEPLLSHTHRVRTYSAHSSVSDLDQERPRVESVVKEKTDVEKPVVKEVTDVEKSVEKSNKEANLREILEASGDEADGSIFSMPHRGACKQIGWVLIWPISLLFYVTIPDCRTERWQKWFCATFLIAITYIGLLSYLVSWMVTVIGHTFGIPDTVMGLTFLAAGTSVPEAISSVIVSRQGFGNMAISNSVGSNVFDILFCLGLPWLIKAIMSPAKDYAVTINSKGFGFSVSALLTTVVLMFATVAFNRFKLNKIVGWTCLFTYAAFLVISSLFELNVFGHINLPTCVE